MGRKHCGKRRNCSLRAISPFPTVFSKGLSPEASKGVIAWELVKDNLYLILTSILYLKEKKTCDCQDHLGQPIRETVFLSNIENSPA